MHTHAHTNAGLGKGFMAFLGCLWLCRGMMMKGGHLDPQAGAGTKKKNYKKIEKYDRPTDRPTDQRMDGRTLIGKCGFQIEGRYE